MRAYVILLLALFVPCAVLAVSLFRGGRLGQRWNQSGQSLAQADKRLRGDQP